MSQRIFIRLTELDADKGIWTASVSQDTDDTLVETTLARAIQTALTMIPGATLDNSAIMKVSTFVSNEVATELDKDANVFNELPVDIKFDSVNIDFKIWEQIGNNTFVSSTGIILLVCRNNAIADLARQNVDKIDCIAITINN